MSHTLKNLIIGYTKAYSALYQAVKNNDDNLVQKCDAEVSRCFERILSFEVVCREDMLALAEFLLCDLGEERTMLPDANLRREKLLALIADGNQFSNSKDENTLKGQASD